MTGDLYSSFSLTHRLVRLLGRVIPEVRGKSRLLRVLHDMSKPWPRRGIIRLDEGSVFCADFNHSTYARLYLYGVYEPQVLWYIQALLEPGDALFDVGANYGLYTVRGAGIVGEAGEVHAFEPLPEAWRYVEENIEINKLRNVVLNRVAVGADCGRGEIHRFDELPVGHASLSDLGRREIISYECDVVTLDWYVRTHRVCGPEMIKLDVEGSELDVLRGASDVLCRSRPAVIVEINYDTAGSFGYEPDEIVRWLSDFSYECWFYSAKSGQLRPIEGQFQLIHGSDIVCVASDRHRFRMECLHHET